jgi:hypothetical protein
MRRLVARLLAGIALLSGLLVMPATQAVAHEEHNPLAAVRQATAKFQDVSRDHSAGYDPLLSCFDLPGVGGMGQHYVNLKLLDDRVSPTTPEGLVYEVDGNELTLVAVVYISPQPAWHASQPPRLFGQWFLRNDTLGLWTLHAWTFRHNPLGTLASYKPRVEMCPGHQPTDN